MQRWITVGASALGGIAALGITASAVGTMLWNRGTARAIARVTGAADATAPGRAFSREHLDGLPAPVARYFELALTPGQRMVKVGHIRHAGDFWTASGTRASRFTSVEHFSTSPPAFVWDADIRLMPLVPTRVRDSYLAGEGAMYAKVAGIVPVVNQRGTPSMASGSLVRYLGEAVWFPTALLPGPGVSWSPIDESSARVTLTDGPTTVWLDVHFAERGEIDRVSTIRDRDVDGVGVPTPWVAFSSDYKRFAGMMIPTAGEVAWELPEGRFTYWRGRVVDATYELAR